MKNFSPAVFSLTTFAVAAKVAIAIAIFKVGAQTLSADIVGNAEQGADYFETICAQCHGDTATAPTLRGIINRPVASVNSFQSYSEALKAKQSETWTVTNLNAYLKSPFTFAPDTLMDREFPDAQMRADVIAFLAMLPPPR